MLENTYQRVAALSQRLLQVCEETNLQMRENRERRNIWLREKKLLDKESLLSNTNGQEMTAQDNLSPIQHDSD